MSRKTFDEYIIDYKDHIIGSRMPRFKPVSFYRFGDKNLVNNLICLNYLSNRGQTIDQFVFDLNQVHGDGYFSEQDVIDFIIKYQTHNPFKR